MHKLFYVQLDKKILDGLYSVCIQMEDITKQNKSVIPNPDVHPFSILARISFHSHMFHGDLGEAR